MSFAAADEMRRQYGRALDVWLARTETPSRLVLERSGVNSARGSVHARDTSHQGTDGCAE